MQTTNAVPSEGLTPPKRLDTLRITMTGTQLKWRRVRLDWTQEQLAKTLGIARNTVARYESGRLPIPKLVALAIENVYKAALKDKGGE
jgi:DNA-binding XRE family transcriptional regulator